MDVWNLNPPAERNRAGPGWPATYRGTCTILVDGGGPGDLGTDMTIGGVDVDHA